MKSNIKVILLSTSTIQRYKNCTKQGKPGIVDTKMHEVPFHALCTHLSAMASVTSTKGRRLKLQKLQLQFRFLGVFTARNDLTGTMKEDFRTIYQVRLGFLSIGLFGGKWLNEPPGCNKPGSSSGSAVASNVKCWGFRCEQTCPQYILAVSCCFPFHCGRVISTFRFDSDCIWGRHLN